MYRIFKSPNISIGIDIVPKNPALVASSGGFNNFLRTS